MILDLFRKKKPIVDIPDMAGMPIPTAHLQALQASDQMLISYPRSGNTWLLHLVTKVIVLGQPDRPQDQNPGELVRDIHQCPPGHEAQQEFRMPTRILKSHNLRDVRAHRAVYLFRAAADTLLSYYHFQTFHKQPWSIAGETPDDFCRRLLSTWKEHLELAFAMQAASPERVLFVSYEQLLTNGPTELRRIVDFYGLSATEETLAVAIESSTIEKLRAWDRKRRASAKDQFFRNGRAGSSDDELAPGTLAFLKDQTAAIYCEGLRLAATKT
jgi:hypothetical protein